VGCFRFWKPPERVIDENLNISASDAEIRRHATFPKMKRYRRISRHVPFALAALAIGGILPVPAQAYEQQLTTEAIREAFLLGSRNDEITVEFWNHYDRLFPGSSPALHVGAVEVLTPYAQVVFDAQHYMINENAVDAVQRYSGRSLPLLVRVSIYYSSNVLPGKCDIERESSVLVTQGRPLKPQKITYHPQHALFGKSGSRSPGVQVELQFDPAQIASRELTIRVSFEDGGYMETTFDLARLK
jgi:hypothetical protein